MDFSKKSYPDPVRLRPDPKLCISVLEVLLEIERNIEGNVSSTIGLILYDNAVHISTILNITYLIQYTYIDLISGSLQSFIH